MSSGIIWWRLGTQEVGRPWASGAQREALILRGNPQPGVYKMHNGLGLGDAEIDELGWSDEWRAANHRQTRLTNMLGHVWAEYGPSVDPANQYGYHPYVGPQAVRGAWLAALEAGNAEVAGITREEIESAPISVPRASS